MTNQSKRTYKKEYASVLLRIAEGDYNSSKILLDAKFKGRPENIVYLAQQSIEKNLKAALVHLGIGFPMVHDLGILVALFPDKMTPPFGFDLKEFNQYATVRRYEEGYIELSEKEITVAVESAEQILIWAKGVIGSPK
ncbi:MAG: HEPN domain-containing protein [Bdellovibrionales bacterium]|nr:HEPN domain-containing protein [Bdellovibrionales bacterium]